MYERHGVQRPGSPDLSPLGIDVGGGLLQLEVQAEGTQTEVPMKTSTKTHAGALNAYLDLT